MPDSADWDEHPDLVIDVLRQSHQSMAIQLRRLAIIARQTPHISAERALNDAALVVEKTLDDLIAQLGIPEPIEPIGD